MAELEQKSVDLAIAELTEKTLGMTEEFLKIHEIEHVDGKPKVVFVRVTDDVQVYFAVKDERFHYCIRVTIEPDAKVRWAYTEDLVEMSLVVTSKTVSADELRKMTFLKPFFSWNKGDYVRRSKVPAKWSGVNFTPYTEPDDIENYLLRMLEFLEQDKERIKALIAAADDAVIYTTITAHNGNTHIGGTYLEPQILKRIVELGVAIDLDFYAAGNFFKDDDYPEDI